MHFKKAADAFFGIFGGIQDGGAFCQGSAIDADIGETSDIGVCDDLKGEGGEGIVVIGVNEDLFVTVNGRGLSLTAVERRGKPIDDGVEKLLYAFIFKGGAAEDGIEFVGDRPLCGWQR